MKHHNPILDDLHKIREAIGRAHDFDVRRIAESIRLHEKQRKEQHLGHELPQQPKRRPKTS